MEVYTTIVTAAPEPRSVPYNCGDTSTQSISHPPSHPIICSNQAFNRITTLPHMGGVPVFLNNSKACQNMPSGPHAMHNKGKLQLLQKCTELQTL